MLNENGVKELSLEELDMLFNDDGTQETPPADDTADTETSSDNSQSVATETAKTEETKAFAKRLRESTDKAVNAEREAIAKNMGFSSYSEMIQSREKKLMEDNGIDPEQASPVIEQLVAKRLNEDPRIKELELLRRKQIEEFGKKELSEITSLTGGEITSLAQLPKEVIDLWKQKGSLKSAYMELEGEKLINRIRSEQSKGSTGHMNSVTGSKMPESNKRLLTDEEKKLWKLFNPSITDDELNKKMTDK